MIGPLESQPMVFVIDDDPSVCKALSNVFRSVGLGVDVLGSTTQLLERRIPDVASCLVLDVGLPNLSGLDFQVELAKANIDIPVVFMAGHGDIPTTVRAMKAGAVDFLIKPFRDQDMLDAVATQSNAIGSDATMRRLSRICRLVSRPWLPASGTSWL